MFYFIQSEKMPIFKVRKRSGAIVAFDKAKIFHAINAAMKSSGEEKNEDVINQLIDTVL